MAEATSSRKPAMTPLDFMRGQGGALRRLTPEEWAEYFDEDVRKKLKEYSKYFDFQAVASLLFKEIHEDLVKRIPEHVRDRLVVVVYQRYSRQFLFFTDDSEWLYLEVIAESATINSGVADRELLVKLFMPGGLFPNQIFNSFSRMSAEWAKERHTAGVMLERLANELWITDHNQRTMHTD